MIYRKKENTTMEIQQGKLVLRFEKIMMIQNLTKKLIILIIKLKKLDVQSNLNVRKVIVDERIFYFINSSDFDQVKPIPKFNKISLIGMKKTIEAME
jgi:hypothetical protein